MNTFNEQHCNSGYINRMIAITLCVSMLVLVILFAHTHTVSNVVKHFQNN